MAKLLSIAPLQQSVFAVYYDFDKKELFRQRGVCLAMVELDGENQIDVFGLLDSAPFLDSLSDVGNFLGYEFDGDNKDWSSAIHTYETERGHLKRDKSED